MVEAAPISTATRPHGRDRFPLPNPIKLASGALLRRDGDDRWYDGAPAVWYRGPHELAVFITLDRHSEPEIGELLHMSLSIPRGYPDWDTIYAVARAVFGTEIDCMMPIPREEAFIHGVHPDQITKRKRQVFHVIEMPYHWPTEAWA